MKKVLYVILALICTAACNEPATETLDVTGQWELTDLTTRSIQIGDQTIEVYMDLKEDNTFQLWQKIGEGRHRNYKGTWQLTGTTLTGKYSDGKEWGTAYEVSIENGDLLMTESKTGTETYRYKSCTIPAGL